MTGFVRLLLLALMVSAWPALTHAQPEGRKTDQETDRQLAEAPVPPPRSVPMPRRAPHADPDADYSGWTATGVTTGLTLGLGIGSLLSLGDSTGAQIGALFPVILPIGLAVLFRKRAEREGWNPRLGATLAGIQPGLLLGGLGGAALASTVCEDGPCARRMGGSLLALGTAVVMGLFSRYRRRAGHGSAVFHALVVAGMIGGLFASAFTPDFRPMLHGAAAGAFAGTLFTAAAPGFDW